MAQLVGEADPAKWERLRGDARGAVDLRIAAEILLRYYDELAAARRAPRLPHPRNARSRDPFGSRLQTGRPLDPVLTEFGLSPHPSLILVVEGAAELLIFPRLMAHFGVRTDSEFIAVEDREGVRKDLRPLLAYAIAPRLEPEEGGEYLEVQRPLTRILVISDAEGPMKTAVEREKRRQEWCERLMRTLPRSHRTDTVRKILSDLVAVETWDRRGLDFEFTHFTDLELAKALIAIDRRDSQSLVICRQRVALLRRQRGNLKTMLNPWGSKVELAEALWPVLQGKVAKAQTRRTHENIPIVRVLARAIDLAREWPRGGFVIPLHDRG